MRLAPCSRRSHALVASAKAYVNALNKLGARLRVNPQYGTEAALVP